MLKSLSFYAGSAREAIKKDDARDATYAKIHQASASIFENPPELKALPWIRERKNVATAPADALNAAVRTFATRMPKIQIQPLDDNEEEYARIDKLETAMEWEFKRMNSVGRKSPHWKIVEYAMKYCAVAIETTYLPYLYSGQEKSPRIKEILRTRNFRWTVHDPSSVHARESEDSLESIVTTQVKTAAELLDMFGDTHKGMSEVLAKCNRDDPTALASTYFTLYDYTDWDARVKWVAPCDRGIVNRDAPEGIELMREKRSISFLPWVYVDNEEPILKQMVDAGLWETVNILRTMQFSKTVDMVAHPEYWIQTPDGTLRNVEIDNSNPNQPLVTGPGINVQQLRPPALDPQLATQAAQAEQEVFRTTVAQILASVEKYAGTQNFSVVNAMLNAAVAQLSLSQMVAERAETAAMIQNFRWIEETGIPMIAFRPGTKGESRKAGKEVSIRLGEFDTDYLYLDVNLAPTTMMDKQAEINNTINMVERLGMSYKMAWDLLGQDNYELSETQKTEEALYQAHVQSKAREIMAAAEMKAQQAAQQPQPNPQNAASVSQFAGQQGFPSTTGAPATMPGQGREQLTGQSAAGEELA